MVDQAPLLHPFRRPTWWAVAASLLLGWAAFFLDVPVVILNQPVRVSFIFGSVLPMVVAMAWGWRMGLLSATLGLGGLFAFKVWPENGWPNLPTGLMNCLWFTLHGWAADRRRSGQEAWWVDPYVVEATYELAYVAYILTLFRGSFALNPAPWAPSAATALPLSIALAIAIKSALNGFLVVLAADALLHLAPLGRFLGLEQPKNTRHDTLVISIAVGIGCLLWTLETLMDSLLREPAGLPWWREFLHPSPERLVSRLLLFVVCLACGIAGARMVRRRGRMNEALKASEEDLRITLYSIGDAVISTDAEGRVIRLNPVAERLTGWSADEAAGRPLVEIFPIRNAASNEPVPNPVAKVLATGEVMGLANHTVLRSRQGTDRQIADSAAPIRRADGTITGVVLVFRDVTEQVRLEEQLRQSHRLDSLGQLAGGVAHDFNNMLAVIMGGAELLQHNLGPVAAAGAERPLGMILETAKRASDLTGKLLGFARKAKWREEVFDLHHEVEAVVGILQHTVDRRINIVCDLGAEASQIIGDPALIQNAVMNLALNARDAMPDGGILEFRTCAVSPGDPILAELQDGEPSHIALSVRDTGTGISEEIRAHLFEPFLTTKAEGKGTGLGLASVYGTVRAHQGAIRVESRKGEGTTFTMVFPARSWTPVSPPLASVQAQSLNLAGLTVLAADDDPGVCTILAAHLEQLGATVIQTKDGQEALARFRHESGRIDLVILDQIMPNLNGADTFHAIHALNPAVPVVIASGFAADASVTDLERAGLAGFLGKPYRRQDLVRLLSTLFPGR